MADWNADAYHRISAPQQAWGRRVLQGMSWRGDETVLDAGCGTGHLTRLVAERIPRGRIVALDGSMNMARVARDQLAPDFRERLLVIQAHLLHVPLRDAVDIVFSTATFHWVLDHERLFRELHTALRPGGRLIAQCGGAANLTRLHAHAEALMHEPSFAAYFRDWTESWLFADADTTAARLRGAGFVDVETSLEEAPTPFESAAAFREFVTNVVCRPHLARLPDQPLRERFMDAIVDRSQRSAAPLVLDYWRLNMRARRPNRPG